METQHPDPAARRLLTVAQAATYLGRSGKNVRHMAASGAWPVVRTDGRMMFDVCALDRIAQELRKPGVSRVVLDVPRLIRPARTIQWFRVTISAGHVACKDDTIRRKVEALKPPGGPSGSDPEPDCTLADLCHLFLFARIVEKTRTGSEDKPSNGAIP